MVVHGVLNFMESRRSIQRNQDHPQLFRPDVFETTNGRYFKVCIVLPLVDG